MGGLHCMVRSTHSCRGVELASRTVQASGMDALQLIGTAAYRSDAKLKVTVRHPSLATLDDV